MDKVRIGLIGAGGVARARHLPRLAAIDEVELALVWSRDGDEGGRGCVGVRNRAGGG